jgi:hypothetical protein
VEKEGHTIIDPCDLYYTLCSYCGHELLNNQHGPDQNDFIWIDGEYKHSGICQYCKICNQPEKSESAWGVYVELEYRFLLEDTFSLFMSWSSRISDRLIKKRIKNEQEAIAIMKQIEKELQG